MSLKDLVKALATNILQFQQNAQTQLQNLENQIGQMATSLSQLEAQGSVGKLPSKTERNPWKSASTVSLRNGNHLEDM